MLPYPCYRAISEDSNFIGIDGTCKGGLLVYGSCGCSLPAAPCEKRCCFGSSPALEKQPHLVAEAKGCSAMKNSYKKVCIAVYKRFYLVSLELTVKNLYRYTIHVLAATTAEL